MRLLVCGGRDYGLVTAERRKIYTAIAEALNWVPTDHMDTWIPPKGTVIITGGARGVDTVADEWATVHWTQFEEYKADWDKHGKAAGPTRNKRMIDEGKPDVVLAFPGGGGTADMVRRAEAAGIRVIKVPA